MVNPRSRTRESEHLKIAEKSLFKMLAQSKNTDTVCVLRATLHKQPRKRKTKHAKSEKRAGMMRPTPLAFATGHECHELGAHDFGRDRCPKHHFFKPDPMLKVPGLGRRLVDMCTRCCHGNTKHGTNLDETGAKFISFSRRIRW